MFRILTIPVVEMLFTFKDIQKTLAEGVGTFCLVFAGTGAVVINEWHPDHPVTHVGVAITFGLVVMSMIYAIGEKSGAHINPAVTFAFWVARRFDGRLVVPYVVAQILGALMASFVLKFLFPTVANLGCTLPAEAWQQSFILEFILTAMLMFVILQVSSGSKEMGIMAGIAIGGTVALEAMFAGPVCGASMNPARSLGPAVASNLYEHLWVYLVATTLGAVFAVALHVAILTKPESLLSKEEGESEGRSV